ncbi:omptin family outer membrane protease [Treponema ruminis]|uniref:Outer membrane protein n=1 Tax=Treponema ruminis TaxID=744515 RepID=A0A7W8LL17_9SPIR|nr:omptin family outer membrane protease [Treponema ruminis]MBB5225002.1 hypothetical protein [Treponema ruminis]
MISFSTAEILFNVQSEGRKKIEDIWFSSPSAVDEVTMLFCKQLNIEPSFDKNKKVSPRKTLKPKDEKKSAFSLSVEPLFGMRWGQINEYVFLKESYFKRDKLSELNWEIKPEWYYGAKISGGWKNIFLETGFKIGIPMRSGKMMDSDWQNIQFAAEDGGNTWKTNYSESKNYLEEDFQFSVKAGYDFHLYQIVKIKPAVAFDYQTIKFMGKGGTGWYGKSMNQAGAPYYHYSDTSHQEIKDFSGRKVIGYRRVADYLWLGSDFSIDLPMNFEANTGFFFAPYVYAVSYDNHFLKSVDYADLTYGYFAAFKWNLGLSYTIAKRHSILFNANYFFMRVLRGEDYSKSSSKNSYDLASGYEGGAGARYFDMTLSYRFKIF